MSNKTLYVSDEDEATWSKAQKLGVGGEGSLSKVVAAALGEYVSSREAADEDDLVVGAKQRVADRGLVANLRRLIRNHGVNTISWAIGRALFEEGVSRSRAGVKARAALTLEGRETAARKAVATKGIEGRRRDARKAAATRKAKAGQLRGR